MLKWQANLPTIASMSGNEIISGSIVELRRQICSAVRTDVMHLRTDGLTHTHTHGTHTFIQSVWCSMRVLCMLHCV